MKLIGEFSQKEQLEASLNGQFNTNHWLNYLHQLVREFL